VVCYHLSELCGLHGSDILLLRTEERSYSRHRRECPLLYTDADILHLLSLLHTEERVSSLHSDETVPLLYVEAADLLDANGRVDSVHGEEIVPMLHVEDAASFSIKRRE